MSDLKKIEEIVREHFYPGPVAGSTARLAKALADYVATILPQPTGEPDGWLVRAVGGTMWNFWDEDPALDENIGGGDRSRFEIKHLYATPADALTRATRAEAERDAAIARADRAEAAHREIIAYAEGEDIMRRWDVVRGQIALGAAGSGPRDAFESWLARFAEISRDALAPTPDTDPDEDGVPIPTEAELRHAGAFLDQRMKELFPPNPKGEPEASCPDNAEGA